MWGRSELPPQDGVAYAAFIDPSGGSNDAMTLAVAHLDGDICVLDAVAEVRAPFDPVDAVERFVTLLRRYGVSTITGDHYAGDWPTALFSRSGIEYVKSERPKNLIYIDFLPLVNARQIELLDLPRMATQFVGLERKTARSGRDSIDHIRGAHDDLANAVAGALVGLYLDRRPALVNIKDVIPAEEAGDAMPAYCQYVFMVVVDVGPDIAVVFGGSRSDDREMGRRHTLNVLDVDLLYFRPGLFGELVERLKDMAKRWYAHVVIFAPEHMRPQLEGRGVQFEILPPDPKPEHLLTFASDAIGRRLVQFCAPAVAKMKTGAIGAALALRGGDPVESALRAALISAIWLKHGNA
jgi:hypothetical protein